MTTPTAQEALSNIARRSGATRAKIEWKCDAQAGALLRIADNGSGFDPVASPPGHFGLQNMRGRAEEIGASFTLVTAPGEGAGLRVELNGKRAYEH